MPYRYLYIGLLFLDFHLSAQPDTSITKIITGVTKYRNEQFQRDSIGILRFGALMSEADQLKIHVHLDPENPYDMYLYDQESSNAKKIDSTTLRVVFSKSANLFGSQIDPVKILEDHKFLMDCIEMGVLQKSYPFKINPGSGYFEEMSFYQIKDGESVAEIGAGLGTFSILTSTCYNNMNLYVNELDEKLLEYIKNGFEQCSSKNESVTYNLVKGYKNSTELEGKNINKIIIRNSFHHFKNKKKMLESIKKSLDANGILYLMEINFDYNLSDIHPCKKVLTDTEIKSYLSEAGFDLVKQKLLSDEVLYAYKIK